MSPVRCWPEEEEGQLWLPCDGDLEPVPPILTIEECDFDDWVEIIGKAPEHFDSYQFLYVAHLAAAGSMEAVARPDDDGITRELQAIRKTVEENRVISEEILDRQSALTDTYFQIAACMESSDRFACEQKLQELLDGLYGRLCPQARSHLLAAIQISRVPDLAAPAAIVLAVCAAFERQLQESVACRLLAFLKYKGIKKLYPPASDSSDSRRPVFGPTEDGSRMSLGAIELLLRNTEQSIGEYCDLAKVNRANILGAIAAIRDYRNDAAHGRAIDSGTAKSLLENWLDWRGEGARIFATLFPVEGD